MGEEKMRISVKTVKHTSEVKPVPVAPAYASLLAIMNVCNGLSCYEMLKEMMKPVGLIKKSYDKAVKVVHLYKNMKTEEGYIFATTWTYFYNALQNLQIVLNAPRYEGFAAEIIQGIILSVEVAKRFKKVFAVYAEKPLSALTLKHLSLNPPTLPTPETVEECIKSLANRPFCRVGDAKPIDRKEEAATVEKEYLFVLPTNITAYVIYIFNVNKLYEETHSQIVTVSKALEQYEKKSAEVSTNVILEKVERYEERSAKTSTS